MIFTITPGRTLPEAIGDTRVISYTYDPLSRLSQAAYSSGECYQYGYDHVGNRTAMTTTVSTTTYQYDPANRLTNAGGVNYTWDNNGNLINDGSALYRYDRANRLISTTLNSTTSLFNYNGDGVRLKQIIAGTVTTYTQDLAAPLPVVLQAKTGATTTKYLYATGTHPQAQNVTAWEYLLPDALGSVRQIANTSGYINLTKDYEPYGSVLSSSGSGNSAYGFTGEERDQSGLIFLRARYMQPRLGVFVSRDPWSGNMMRPGSLNGYAYVEGNPVNAIDPSGQIVCFPPNHWVVDPETGERRCVPPDSDGTPPLLPPVLGEVAQGPTTDPSGTIGKLVIIGIGVCLYELANLAARTRVEPIPTPNPPRSPVRVQLQEGSITYNTIPLPDLGGGVTVAQVVAALTALRQDRSIPKRHQRGAEAAYQTAIRWTLGRPPYGVGPNTRKSFNFPTDPAWRFDIEVLVGQHLMR
jgi:RHS repeat-associated protein